MKFYLDTELTRFGGSLMSLALAPADLSLPFYVVVEPQEDPSPWSVEHVVPRLDIAPVSREKAARALASYLRGSPDIPVVIADWPADLAEFANLFLLSDQPGKMVNTRDFDLCYRRPVGFLTHEASLRPHNALADAIALRDYFEKN